jgi:hypothetical protein
MEINKNDTLLQASSKRKEDRLVVGKNIQSKLV